MSFYTHTGEVIAFIEIPGSSILYLNAEISNICMNRRIVNKKLSFSFKHYRLLTVLKSLNATVTLTPRR